MANVVKIAGSPAYPSRSHAVLEYSRSILESKGLHTDAIAVRDLPAEDLLFGRYDSAALQHPKALIEQANGVIIATPIYKTAYTGVLKAFLDLLSPGALSGKIILPIATGGTLAHLLSIDYALKPVLAALGARHIVAGVYIVDSQIQQHDGAKVQLVDEIEQRLQDSLEEFTTAINQAQRVFEKSEHSVLSY